MNRAGAWSMTVALVGWAASATPTYATGYDLAEPVDNGPQAVQRVGEALSERHNFNWYDESKDALQPIRLSEPAAPARPLNLSFLKVLAWGALVAVVLALAYLIFHALLWRTDLTSRRPSDLLNPRPIEVDRVEALPFLERRAHDNLLGQARRHYEQGNFAEAIIYLFSFQLVELDKHSLIRLARGKTNRQYLSEVGARRPLSGLVEQTMTTFEDVFFGGRPLDRSAFESCWNRLGEFETMLVQAPA